MTITIGYSPIYLAWEGSHASPQRAALSLAHIQARAAAEDIDVKVIDPSTFYSYPALKKALCEVHDPTYVERMLDGTHPAHPGAQGRVALTMFDGTVALVREIEKREMPVEVFFNPQGAKHHAAYDQSTGFCAFNDMAWAAQHFTKKGLKVAYLDWDAHHGDGVEDLTLNNPNVLTISIHQGGVFPGTGLRSRPSKKAWNFPLSAGDGDEELLEMVERSLDIIEKFEPDVLLMAIGADGHESDPLAGLNFTLDGYHQAAEMVGEYLRGAQIPALVGGAGGYQPFTFVPLIWADVIMTLDEQLEMGRPPRVASSPTGLGALDTVL